MTKRVSITSILIILAAFSCMVVAAEMYSYNDDIAPILSENGCVGCHSDWAGSFSSIMAKVSNISQTRSIPIVYTSHADSSVIIWRLEGQFPNGAALQSMPYGADKLDTATIQKVRDWIDQGANEEIVAVEHKSWSEIKSLFK